MSERAVATIIDDQRLKAYRVFWDTDAPILRVQPAFDNPSVEDWERCVFYEGQRSHPSEENPYRRNVVHAAIWNAGRCAPLSSSPKAIH